jgi:hypothetical protein
MQRVPVRQVASTAGKGVNDMQSIPGGYAVAVFHCVVPRNVNPMTAQAVSVQKAEFHVREATASDASRRCVWLTIQIETETFEIEVRTMWTSHFQHSLSKSIATNDIFVGTGL